jgi:hypothetical protein
MQERGAAGARGVHIQQKSGSCLLVSVWVECQVTDKCNTLLTQSAEESQTRRGPVGLFNARLKRVHALERLRSRGKEFVTSPGSLVVTKRGQWEIRYKASQDHIILSQCHQLGNHFMVDSNSDFANAVPLLSIPHPASQAASPDSVRSSRSDLRPGPLAAR